MYLVNGGHAKNILGRKSDAQDCMWLRELHTYGLLRKSFIPEDNIRALRAYTRLYDDHIEMKSTHILHMQKALISMNIKRSQVISQITGVSGLKIIKAILAGERDTAKLAILCDKQILKNKYTEVVLSLEGHYKKEYLFALSQAVSGYTFYEDLCTQCEAEIQSLLEEMTKDLPTPQAMTPPRPIRHNVPKIDNLHTKLVTLTEGSDVARISGLSPVSFLKLMGEVGTNLSTFPTEKHFTSWAGLAPRKHQSGKLSKHKKNAKTVVGQIFREAAQSFATP